jgi:TonB family protein
VTATSLEAKFRQLRLDVGLKPDRKDASAQAWKQAIGTNRICARFALLPAPKPRWGRMGLSAIGQVAILVFLLVLPLIFPPQIQTALKFDVVELMQPVTEIPVALPAPPPPKIKPKVPPPEPKPVIPEPVQLNSQQPHIFLSPKPEPQKIHTMEARPVELNASFEQVKIDAAADQPRRPKEDVQVGILGGPPTAAVVAAVKKVQTGGLGDPNGIAGPGSPNRRANINAIGSPVLPPGGGTGNGSAGPAGTPATVAEGHPQKMLASGSPVYVLSKPNPIYTAEGRTLRIEGDVILEVVFLASGQLQVVRVVSGLGHGLDEAAIQAAKEIRFKPANRDGQPVDSTARLRIEFRVTR